jgi:hypothetical protein
VVSIPWLSATQSASAAAASVQVYEAKLSETRMLP